MGVSPRRPYPENMADPITTALLQNIRKVTVETAYLPTIQLDDPFAPGPPSPLLQLLKPKITIETSVSPVVLTPYGDPGETKWPWVLAAMMIGSAALLYLGWQFYRRP
jgi:hypothetical protein